MSFKTVSKLKILFAQGSESVRWWSNNWEAISFNETDDESMLFIEKKTLQ